MSNIEELFNALGIALVDNTGQYKPTEQILSELSNVWNNLTETQWELLLKTTEVKMAEGCQAPPHKIKIVAIIGEAGCGKDTIMQEVLRMHDYWWHEIISYTSRPPRDNEKDGVNYYFLSEPEFCDEILNDNMLEWTVFNNWYYGTGIKSINPNNINIGVFNPAGIKNLLKNENLDVKVYRITCDEKTRIIRQLEREVNPNIQEILRRLSADKEDFKEENLDFPYETLQNEKFEDLMESARIIAFHSWTD